MTLENLHQELKALGIAFTLKNGKIYFNGEFNKQKFVRYVYERKDTGGIDIYVCIDKPYGETQGPQDKKDAAREKNRWIKNVFNKFGLTEQFPEWTPSTPSAIPAAPQTSPVQKSSGLDDFDWSMVTAPTPEGNDFDPFKAN